MYMLSEFPTCNFEERGPYYIGFDRGFISVFKHNPEAGFLAFGGLRFTFGLSGGRVIQAHGYHHPVSNPMEISELTGWDIFSIRCATENQLVDHFLWQSRLIRKQEFEAMLEQFERQDNKVELKEYEMRYILQ